MAKVNDDAWNACAAAAEDFFDKMLAIRLAHLASDKDDMVTVSGKTVKRSSLYVKLAYNPE